MLVEPFFGRYNQQQLAFTQQISQGTQLKTTEINFGRLKEEKKGVYLKVIKNSKTQR